MLLLDRCWLRLTVVTVAALPSRLPPDASGEAPELARYQELRRDGLGSWEAQQRCWEEFGTEACRQAQVRFWRAQERGNRGWTLERYLALRSEYRFRWESPRPRALPMLVLARSGLSTSGNDGEDHRLLWLCPGADGNGGTMRHTCA